MNWKEFFKLEKSKTKVFALLWLFYFTNLLLICVTFVVDYKYNDGSLPFVQHLVKIIVDALILLFFVLNPWKVYLTEKTAYPLVYIVLLVIALPLNIIYFYFLSCLTVRVYRHMRKQEAIKP